MVRGFHVSFLVLAAVWSATANAAPLEITQQHTSLKRIANRGDAGLWQRVLSAKEADTHVFVRAKDAQAQKDLAALGVIANVGGWTPVTLDKARLSGALSSAGALDISEQPPHRPYLEVSTREIGVTSVQAGVGVEKARSGHGVLVGIIDTGLDLTHPAFMDDDGHSRVIAVWDQDHDGNHPDKFGYGNECKESVIAAGGCSIDDPNGHGTHVAGIAAGNGQLGGIAPQAKIAVVRSSTFTRLADAVDYLARLADSKHMPLVINLSVGGQYGAHDGATPLEQWLDDKLGEGKILVAAAGNEGESSLHASVGLSANNQRLAVENIAWGGAVQTSVDMWSDEKASVTLVAELWHRGAPVAQVTLDGTNTDVKTTTLSRSGSFSVGLTFTKSDEDGRTHRTLLVDGSQASALSDDDRLVLVVGGSGRLDGWVSQSDGGSTSRFGGDTQPGWAHGDGQETVAVPASGKSVIAVGAYATRNSWVSEDDGTQHIQDLGIGKLATYSSVGPTAAPDKTGLKPDITAPGSVIISARARSVPFGPDVVDHERVIMQGTSMASPHVAGVVALMLEANPRLKPADVRRIFAQTARADAQTGAVPNVAWGVGKIDAQASVAKAEQEPQAGGCAAVDPSFVVVLVVGIAALLASRKKEALPIKIKPAKKKR
jgi:minor extracellular serine protease Vpr